MCVIHDFVNECRYLNSMSRTPMSFDVKNVDEFFESSSTESFVKVLSDFSKLIKLNSSLITAKRCHFLNFPDPIKMIKNRGGTLPLLYEIKVNESFTFKK